MLTVTDLVAGLDFTGLGAAATAADHTTLVENATPLLDSATEGKGFVLWTVDSALDTPVVPNPTALGPTYTKWKRYLWIRVPHSTATNTIPLIYCWNDSATSVATYLKWQRPEANFTSINAAITALDLRVDDLEASSATTLATANAANSTAASAATNASAALTTANAANANATTALANAATAQTTADSAAAAAATASTSASSAITTANAASAAVAASGPQFITPQTLYSSAGARAYGAGDLDVSAYVPSNAKAILLQAFNVVGEPTYTIVSVRRDSGSASYKLLHTGSGSGVAGCTNNNQGMFPVSASRTFQLEVAGVATQVITVQLIGYIL